MNICIRAVRHLGISVLVVLLSVTLSVAQQPDSTRTKIVTLGTGTPNPDPSRAGSSNAIIVDNTPYLVDFGPGVVRRASALSPTWGGDIEALEIQNLKHAFLTHLHSDHTAGFADLILTPWVIGRDTPLQVYGPEGLKKMAHHLIQAYQDDIKYRLYGLEPANNQGWRVDAHEIEQGPIYQDERVKVSAFNIDHGSWPQAFGYRFETPDRIVVISGDTGPSENLVKFSQGANVLMHEVYSLEGFRKKDDFWQRYHSKNHTSTHELGEIANQIKPDLLILYHVLLWGSSEEQILKEVGEVYDGKVVIARDGSVY